VHARLKLLWILLLLGGCAHRPSGPGSPAPPPQAAAEVPEQQQPKPATDHHAHLISPFVAELINGPPLRAIEVPEPIAAFLTHRAELWDQPARLSKLFAADATILIQEEPKFGLFRGSEVAARFLSARFARAYQLTPVSFSASGPLAHLSGYYTRGPAGAPDRIGTFHILLEKQGGSWKIRSEAPGFPAQPPQPAVAAEQLIAAMDAAGVETAVVLSGAVAIGGRWLDIYHDQKEAEERHRQVRAENDWTARQSALFPDRLISFCGLNPLEPYALAELRRCPGAGHRGLKLHFDESGIDLERADHVAKARAVFAAANQMRFPIVVHVGNNEGDAERARRNVSTFLDQVAAAAPDIPIQIAHLWGGSGFSEGALDAYAQAVSAQHPAEANLWFDMAEAPLVALQYGDRSEAILRRVADAVRRIGPHRILFGSDTGGKGHLSPGEAWAQFRAQVPLTNQEFRIIAGNIAPYARAGRTPQQP
jgi:predicted TIM-barrel fold metal-dependent hydrolase